MALVSTTAALGVQPPNADGMISQFGTSLDWRFDPESSQGPWQGIGCEYIAPLRAMGPKGDTSPRDMTLTPADPWRLVNQSGNPTVKWVECTDGEVYSSEASATHTLTIDMPTRSYPNFALSLVRSAPPPGQGVPVYVAVTMQGEVYNQSTEAWDAGEISFVLPMEDADYGLREPFLHAIAPATPGYAYLTDGTIISRGRGGCAMRQGERRETWVFEYALNDAYDASDTALSASTGAHFLIRNGDGDDYWHCFRRDIRLTQGADVTLTVCGAVTAVNLTPIRYTTGSASPVREHWLSRFTDGAPDYNVLAQWATATTWGHVYQPAVGWTVTTADGAGPGRSRKPLLTFTLTEDEYGYPAKKGAQYYRPIVWYCTMDIPAVIDWEDGTISTTEGQGNMVGNTWEMDVTYRNGRGQAFFRQSQTPLYTDWRVNGKASLTLGWDPLASYAIQAREIATGYIPPGGLKRTTDANATEPHALTVEFATFDEVRLRRKEVEYFRQAGGRTVLDWITAVANRTGFGGTVSVAPGVADLIIPLAELPSQPNLAPQDGDGWLQHIDEVCKATGLRVGFDDDGSGRLFVDAGTPDYSHGISAIAFTLDHATANPEDDIYRLEPTNSAEEFRNRLLAIYGPSRYRQTYTAVESDAERLAGIGDDWNRVMVEDDADSPVEAFTRFIRDHYRMQQFVQWTGPLRPELRPDAFVQINGYDDDHDIPDGSIWQIVHVAHESHQEDEVGDALSTIHAVMVYDAGGTTTGMEDEES